MKQSGLPEATLTLTEASAGNADSVANDLFEDHFDAVYRYFSRRIRSREDIEDLVAETFAAALTSRVPKNLDVLVWMYGIARRKLADHLRRQRKGLSVAQRELTTEQNTCDFPEIAMQIEALPSNQREALLLQVLEGLTVAQAAKAMGRSVASVKALTQRAREQLRRECGS